MAKKQSLADVQKQLRAANAARAAQPATTPTKAATKATSKSATKSPAKRKLRPAAAGRPGPAVADQMAATMFAKVEQGLTSEEAARSIVGLPVPALSCRHFLGATGLPLSRIIQIIGEESSCKSSLLAEMCRWFVVYGGLAGILETENKDIARLREAIGQHDPVYLRNVRTAPADTQEAWMRNYIMLVKQWHKASGAKLSVKSAIEDFDTLVEETNASLRKRGPKWTVPFLIAVDSLTAVASEASIEKLLTTGAPSRKFSIEANFLAQFAQALSFSMRGRPIVFVATNHMKPKLDVNGNVIHHSPGGKAFKFMESLEIIMKAGRKIREVKLGGQELTLSVRKTCMGGQPSPLHVRLLWEYRVDPETGKTAQWAMWDWYTASIELLLRLERDKKTVFKAVQEILKLRVLPGKKLTSKPLGLTDPVSFHAAGVALEAHPELLSQLYPLLGITEIPCIQPGDDFKDVLQRARADRAELVQQQYKAIELGHGMAQAITRIEQAKARDLGLDVDEDEEDAEGEDD